MVAQLDALRARGVLQYTLVDIQDRAELEARYGEWVPVLMAGEIEICHYHLDIAALDIWLLRDGVNRA